jgi:hypothetical protein
VEKMNWDLDWIGNMQKAIGKKRGHIPFFEMSRWNAGIDLQYSRNLVEKVNGKNRLDSHSGVCGESAYCFERIGGIGEYQSCPN